MKQIWIGITYSGIVTSSHRMSADKSHAAWKSFPRRAADLAFGAARIGNHSSSYKRIASVPKKPQNPTNWRSKINQVGLADPTRFKRIFYTIDNSEGTRFIEDFLAVPSSDAPGDTRSPSRKRK